MKHTTGRVLEAPGHYGTLQHGMAHCKAQPIRPSFIIMLKIIINKHQNHSIPAVWCMEIASHPISPCDQHFCSLSSLPSITRSNPWGRTLLSATVIQYKGSQSLAITCNHSPSLLGHWKTCTVCLIINTSLLFPFKGLLLICHHSHCSSALCCTPYTLKILHFKFVSFIFTPYKILLLHSHPFNISKPMYFTIQNKKSLQFSSPIGFRLILYTSTSVLQIILTLRTTLRTLGTFVHRGTTTMVHSHIRYGI